jgi:hypothetical protein
VKRIIVTIACVAMTSAAVAMAQAPSTTAAARPQAARPYTPPKTPWGDPDLQGKWPGIELVGVPMQRDPRFGTRNVLTDEEFKVEQARREKQALQDEAEFDLDAATSTPGGDVGGPVSPPPHWLERGKPQYVASLIVDPPDGRMPPLTPEAQQRQQATAAARKASGRGPADSYTDRSLYDRCISRGIAGSFLPVIYNNGNEIIQGPGYVALRNEMIHETRIVYLDGRPQVSPAIRMWLGSSRGRWEGNTLVVETTNLGSFAPGIGVNGGGQRHSDAIKVTDRITRVADDQVIWRMTFEDPQTWTAPFTIELPLRRDDDYGMFEYACHEGNYSMFNILSGARADEKAAAEARARGDAPPAQPQRGGGAGRQGGGGAGGRGGRGGNP